MLQQPCVKNWSFIVNSKAAPIRGGLKGVLHKGQFKPIKFRRVWWKVKSFPFENGEMGCVGKVQVEQKTKSLATFLSTHIIK